MWPKTILTVWPRDTQRLDAPGWLAFQFCKRKILEANGGHDGVIM